jgi:hypothetical protein
VKFAPTILRSLIVTPVIFACLREREMKAEPKTGE